VDEKELERKPLKAPVFAKAELVSTNPSTNADTIDPNELTKECFSGKERSPVENSEDVRVLAVVPSEPPPQKWSKVLPPPESHGISRVNAE
jgi:hypothetical protein